MNRVLQKILSSKTVTNGEQSFPLDYNMDEAEGRLIKEAYAAAKPDTSVEVGCAYGISTLFACEAIADNAKPAVHHIFDPSQSTAFHGIGMRNLKAAGYGDMVELHEVRSEIGLPQLLAAGTRIQAATIDGWHTFDHTLIDFFYINKMLDVGGIIVLDDTMYPAVNHCARHILTYPCYELFGQSPDPRAFSAKRKIRLELSKVVPPLRQSWDTSTAMAFRKTAQDDRSYDWHAPF